MSEKPPGVSEQFEEDNEVDEDEIDSDSSNNSEEDK